jgi:SIR2-like domain
MPLTLHDPSQCVKQLRQTLAADKLAVGFFLGAGCPCAVRVPAEKDGADKPLIPDVRGLTTNVAAQMIESKDHSEAYKKLVGVLTNDGDTSPTIETMLNRIRTLREVAGNADVRGLSFGELDALDKVICLAIKQTVTCSLPGDATPYHALARFIGTQRYPLTELFTTNYDVLMEQSLEACRVPFFDGFVGSSRPFFDQRAIEEDLIPVRWARLWKLHGSINWRFNKTSKSVFRSTEVSDGDELLIHPSHRKYDESRRMPYFVMIDRLRSFLRTNQKPVALFIIGYSFGDEHLNEAIVESLIANPSAACFALQYGDLADYPNARKLARENANLSVLARDAAVIRRQEAKWIAHPATDMAAIKCAFQPIDAAGADKKEVEESEQPHPCRLTIGDFKLLGDFLDEFSAHGAFTGTGANE